MQADSEDTKDSPEFHPLFSSPDGDIVLGTKDGILFRVHSYTLKTTSGWFRAMFSLPQNNIPDSSNIIYVDEDAQTMEGLLRMVCGLPIPRLDTFEIIEPLLYAAEKYDTPGPLSIVRALLMTGPLMDDPLRLYTISCRYGWESEAKQSSTQTLTLDLQAPEHRVTLRKLSTDALLNLFELHHGRRQALRKRLSEPPFVSDAGDASCSHCGSIVSYHTWRELKYVVITEMEARPLGDTIMTTGLNDWPAARACWEARCPHCNKVLYDKKETLRGIQECMDQLPLSVEIMNNALELVTISSINQSLP